MTTWSDRILAPGTRLTGKWNGRTYQIERLLGEGANGRVYLVRRGRASYALKMGFDPLDHQLEVNALRSLSRTASFRHFLMDVDDAEIEGRQLPFCVIKYIEGQSLSEFLRSRGKDWIYVIGLNILQKLADLHKNGWIFCDLKIENMLITGYGGVELIDFGGVTSKGRSVKQFTELYDRGFWNAGDRIADEAYDLFAFAVIFLKATDETRAFPEFQQMLPQNRGPDVLEELMASNPRAKILAPWLQNALHGKFNSTQEALMLWRKLILEKGIHTAHAPVQTPWLQICFAASVALCLFTVFYFWH